MNRKYCKILIVIFAVLFFVGAPLAIFYAQGYRFNFDERKLVKTGGFFIKASPAQCMVYIDDEFTKNTDFIFGESFIKNLLPKEYKIRVEKNGYVSWEKTLRVEKEMVTKAENITLFQKDINFSPVSNKVKAYFPSPDQGQILLKRQGEENYYLELINSEGGEGNIIINEEDLKGVTIKNVLWNHNSEDILIEKEIGGKNSFSIITNLENNSSQTIINLPTSTEEIKFNPYNPNELFFTENKESKNLFKLTLSQEGEPEEIIKNIRSYTIEGRNIFWVDKEGFIFESSLSGEKTEKINSKPFPLEEIEGIKVFNGKVFIESNDNLYIFNKEKEEFEQIENNVKEIILSPDGKRISMINNHEIYLFFLSEILEQPRREENEKVFLTRLSKEIKETFWLNNHYLLFSSGDKIKITETDNRDGLNIITIKEYENPEIFWNSNNNRVYVLSKNNFYRSDQLF